MKRLHRPDLALLIFAFLTLVAIVLLLLLGHLIPPELWAVLFAVLAAAGVAVVPGAVAAVSGDTSPPAALPVAPASSTSILPVSELTTVPRAPAGGVGDGTTP